MAGKSSLLWSWKLLSFSSVYSFATCDHLLYSFIKDSHSSAVILNIFALIPIEFLILHSKRPLVQTFLTHSLLANGSLNFQLVLSIKVTFVFMVSVVNIISDMSFISLKRSFIVFSRYSIASQTLATIMTIVLKASQLVPSNLLLFIKMDDLYKVPDILDVFCYVSVIY